MQQELQRIALFLTATVLLSGCDEFEIFPEKEFQFKGFSSSMSFDELNAFRKGSVQTWSTTPLGAHKIYFFNDWDREKFSISIIKEPSGSSYVMSWAMQLPADVDSDSAMEDIIQKYRGFGTPYVYRSENDQKGRTVAFNCKNCDDVKVNSCERTFAGPSIDATICVSIAFSPFTDIGTISGHWRSYRTIKKIEERMARNRTKLDL